MSDYDSSEEIIDQCIVLNCYRNTTYPNKYCYIHECDICHINKQMSFWITVCKGCYTPCSIKHCSNNVRNIDNSDICLDHGYDHHGMIPMPPRKERCLGCFIMPKVNNDVLCHECRENFYYLCLARQANAKQGLIILSGIDKRNYHHFPPDLKKTVNVLLLLHNLKDNVFHNLPTEVIDSELIKWF